MILIFKALLGVVLACLIFNFLDNFFGYQSKYNLKVVKNDGKE